MLKDANILFFAYQTVLIENFFLDCFDTNLIKL